MIIFVAKVYAYQNIDILQQRCMLYFDNLKQKWIINGDIL